MYMHIVFKEMVSESNLITVPTLLHKDAVEIIDQWLLDSSLKVISIFKKKYQPFTTTRDKKK
jgi:hypothetical protein